MSNSCDAMESSLLGASVHGISHSRILEQIAISFPRGSSWPRDRTRIIRMACRFFTTEPPGKPKQCRQCLKLKEFLEIRNFMHLVIQWERSLRQSLFPSDILNLWGKERLTLNLFNSKTSINLLSIFIWFREFKCGASSYSVRHLPSDVYSGGPARTWTWVTCT